MWDIFQEIRLNDHRARQDSMESKAASLRGDQFDLQRQLAKMALVNQALYELVKEKLAISDEELRRKIREIDVRDGSEDGDLQGPPLRCPKCGSTMTAGALSCQSCGAKVAPRYPFEP